MQLILDPASGLALRSAGCLMFAAAALPKLAQPAAFQAALRGYGLLPDAIVPTLAVLLPALELGIAGTMPARGLDPWPELAGAALLLLLAAAMTMALRGGRAGIACGCTFGSATPGLRWSLVGRNLVLAASLPLCVPAAAAGSAVLTATGLAGGLALFVLLEAANAIWALPARGPAQRRSS